MKRFLHKVFNRDNVMEAAACMLPPALFLTVLTIDNGHLALGLVAAICCAATAVVLHFLDI